MAKSNQNKILFWLDEISAQDVSCTIQSKQGCYIIHVADLETFYADTENELINILITIQGMSVLFRKELIK